jgi:glutamate carboxypeptidase
VSGSSRDLLDYFENGLDHSLSLLRTLVELESNSHDKSGVDALGAFLAEQFRIRGAAAEILPLETSGNAIQALWASGSPGAPVLVLGHLDTVWPRGTIAHRPFRLQDGKAFGPGIFDMKAGILLCLLACQAFREVPARPKQDVIFFLTPDEETGTVNGLPLLEPAAKTCRAVLCMEPPLPGGKAKTSRKGVGQIGISVEGIPAHAGLDHDKGANAILELSRIVIKLQEMTNYERGFTVNVGLIRGGTAGNVVPGFAEALVDFRFTTSMQGRWLEEQIRSLRPSDSRCAIASNGGIERPPLERTSEVAELFEKARSIAGRIGMSFGEGLASGGSDGSFTAAMGIPTLDGLGVDGDGSHAVHEHVIISDIPGRAALLCELLRLI